MTLKKIIDVLEAEILFDSFDMDTEINYVCSSDLMSDLLHFSSKPKSILITGLTNKQVIRTSEIADIKAVIFVLNKRPDRDALEMAKHKHIPLFVTRFSRFTACGKLYSEGLKSCTEEDK